MSKRQGLITLWEEADRVNDFAELKENLQGGMVKSAAMPVGISPDGLQIGWHPPAAAAMPAGLSPNSMQIAWHRTAGGKQHAA